MIRIYDNVIPQDTLSGIEVFLTEKASWNFINDDGSRKKWSVGHVRNSSTFTDIDHYLLRILAENGCDISFIQRAVSNCFRRLDSTQYHQDPGEISYMFYLNSEWKRHWGAPTKFKSKKYHLSRKVYPKPGRMVVFSSKLFHKGTAPTFLLPSSVVGRFSIVFQGTADPSFFKP